MDRFLLIVVSFFSFCSSFAENTEESLYFISAKQFYDPYVYYDDDEYENAFLFSLQDGNLDTIRALSTYEDRINQIEYYVDLSTIVITTEQKYSKHSLSLLNTKNIDFWDLKYPISNEYQDTYFIYRMISDDENNYLSIEYYKDSSIFLKYEKNKKIEYLLQSKLLNFQCTTKKTELIAYDYARNCFTFPIVDIKQENDKLKRPIFQYKINKEDYIHGREITSLYIKNKNYSVILNGFTDKTQNFIVYQHKNNKYNIITIPGNKFEANIWGEWLGGAETYDGNDVYNYIQKPNATLYLYNIPQNRMIEWNSHSNNAAILHIENSEVYYRINDTLYKAPILENSIGTPQVIYQSPILKHVNWLWK